jgi:glycine betaine catabolism B
VLMKKIDNILNNVTMYRLMVYVLGGYIGLGIIFALAGQLAFSVASMIVSLTLLLTSAYITDRVYARILKVPSNTESWLISSLILFLIVRPADSVSSGLYLLLAGALASLSKFVLARQGRHLFNPAALAAAIVSLTGLQSATWWIGSAIFWPVTLIGGLAIVRKIRRFALSATFAATAITVQLVVFAMHHQPLGAGMKGALIASPLIFLATVMLTEPATMPPRRNQQIIFAALVALLYATAWKVGPVYVYPEVALLVGNIYAYAVSPKFRVRMRLVTVRRFSDQVYDYVFRPDRRFAFLPGQYMEWTLEGVPYDSRGNRRTFTIASSPTEQDVHLGIKFYTPSSAFKSTLKRLQPGDSIYASQLAGNFTLDASNDKLVFIAGGIGVTPFRSMVKYLTDTKTTRDIVVLYAVTHAEELAYHDEFTKAQLHGIRYVPIVTEPANEAPGVINAKLSSELIARLVPDYQQRTFYVSGPNRMVDGIKGYLRSLRIAPTRIKTDHFSGY